MTDFAGFRVWCLGFKTRMTDLTDLHLIRTCQVMVVVCRLSACCQWGLGRGGIWALSLLPVGGGGGEEGGRSSIYRQAVGGVGILSSPLYCRQV